MSVRYSPCLVFVYGTLKPGEVNYPRFCEGFVATAEPVLTPGKLYQIPHQSPAMPNGYPALTLEPGWVEGYLLSFTTADVLTRLDQLEDYQIGRSPEENEYQRQLVPIYDREKNFLTEAWGYIMTRQQAQALGGNPLNTSIWSGNVNT